MKNLFNKLFILLFVAFPLYAQESVNQEMLTILNDFTKREINQAREKEIDADKDNIRFNEALERIQLDKIKLPKSYLSPLYTPKKEFLYFKNIFSESEILTFKTNYTTFYNEKGVFQLSFLLTKSNNIIPPTTDQLLELTLYTKTHFVPFYTFDQIISLTIIGAENRAMWTIEFNFNYREAAQQIYKNKTVYLYLNKNLTHDDMSKLTMLFNSNRKLFFRVEASEGSFDFSFQQDAIYFYRTFLHYAKGLNFY